MTVPLIIDAGPALNFFATNHERPLLDVVGGYLSAPETVAEEVKNKSRTDRRFREAHRVWVKLEQAGRLTILSDDVTPELDVTVQRIATMPLSKRLRFAKDLGEVMVLAHAVMQAEAGRSVNILMDDTEGARLASREIARLDGRRAKGIPVGTLNLFNTNAILIRAVERHRG